MEKGGTMFSICPLELHAPSLRLPAAKEVPWGPPLQFHPPPRLPPLALLQAPWFLAPEGW